MKKNNKSRKGFTIVELVIVIAVIAILATVLVPTFSNVIDKANQSKAMQQGRNTFTDSYALDYADGKLDGKENATTAITGGYKVENDVAKFEATIDGYAVTYDGSKWTATKNS